MSIPIQVCDEESALLKTAAMGQGKNSATGTSVPDSTIFKNAELLDRLIQLAECIRIDPHSGDLILQRGQARLTLKENGVVRVQARSIVQVAEEDITLYSAYIDLN